MDYLERWLKRNEPPDSEKTPEQLEEERKRREEEEKEEEELEKACEKWCSLICKIGCFAPILVTYLLLPLREFALRPDMRVNMNPSLSGVNAVVTGGCSGLGLQTAAMLAESGASVVLGCRDPKSSAAALALRTLKKASRGKTSPAVWKLKLDSLDSVRAFATRYVNSSNKLHVLVNNAGSTLACSLTGDKIETAFQVNYLGHFLLTNLLLPTLKSSSPSRVVHVLCRDGYMRAARDWSHRFPEGYLQGWLGLPVPIKEGIRIGSMRVDTTTDRQDMPQGTGGGGSQAGFTNLGHQLAEEDESEDATPEEASEEAAGELNIDWVAGCKEGLAYNNAKLAVLSFSHELERRLRRSPDAEGVSSHAVNPNAVLSDFYDKGTPAGTGERRSPMSYFPPVWIAGKVFGFINRRLSKLMMRSVEHGAKGIFHIASLPALAEHGGGLFDDTETAFTNCGRKPQFCGRVPRAWLPPVVLDEQATGRLWEISAQLVDLPDADSGACSESDGGVCHAST